ncbi:caspase family protein [Aliikangiella sp. IMCC44359]|uniref:caspase family protein n=1 Tax=Aliikangiella sp. IMCC44359 TaxID=3459125 RepID=UPI00403AB348
MNEKHYALVVGINEYPEAPTSYRLNGAINDAQRVEAWLLDPAGGGIKTENCFSLYLDPANDVDDDEFPVRHHINMSFKKIRKKLRQKYEAHNEVAERFYFYFSGHGQAKRLENDNILMCMANWGPDSPNANLSSRLVIKDYLERCLPCEEIVFWTDCCRTRAVDIREGFLDESCRTPWKNGVRPKLFWAGATLHETAAGEALDDGLEHSGYFTRALLEGLKTGQQSAGVSWDSLRDYLKQRVELIAQKDGFPQRAEAYHTADDTTLYFGEKGVGASLLIKLSGSNRNLEIFYNAIESKKIWSNVSGNIEYNNLPLGLYKLVDLDTNESRLIDCSSPGEVIQYDF